MIRYYDYKYIGATILLWVGENFFLKQDSTE